MPCDEGCRTAVFGKTERTVGWEGNGDPVMTGLVRHCTWGNPQRTDRPCLPPLTHSFTLDFIITGVSEALLADEVQPLVEQFLMERGLTLSREKTRIVHIETGFDFLGFNVRKYHGKLLIKPAPSSIAAVKDKVRQSLNPVIRGWASYYRHVVSKQVFDDIDSAIWRTTWNWATRRHPQKSRAWIKDRYYACRDGLDWVFTDGSATLFRMSTLPIQRHIKIRREANPYDPQNADYFTARRRRLQGARSGAMTPWPVA